MSCTNRISDGYESGTCGEKTLPGNRYCIKCRVYWLNFLQKRLAQETRTLANTQREYDALLAEGRP
jgi:hypothetical protein